MENIMVIALFIFFIFIFIFCTNKSQKDKNSNISFKIDNAVRDILAKEMQKNREEISKTTISTLTEISNVITKTQEQSNKKQDNKLTEMTKMLDQNYVLLNENFDRMVKGINSRISDFSLENEKKLDNIRNTIDNRLKNIQLENSKKLDEMRNTVDEKLQKTLESRISKSFELVSKRLEEVQTGLGEMKTLASGVGDLKKVLTNVKSKGILGEVQLSAILEQILAPEQYVKDFAPSKNSKDVVEFAIKLPGNDNGPIYLPIDSKFPYNKHSELLDAYESGDKELITKAKKELITSIKNSAKTIREKYIKEPYTTNFGVMFLPFESLYAEVVNLGMIEQLQNEYKINIAGPTTMAAFLNSLQMGFKTLAIQKRSGEVFKTLGEVKVEFEKFGTVLEQAQTKITKANDDIEKLLGVRTKAIKRKLKDVEILNIEDSTELSGVE